VILGLIAAVVIFAVSSLGATAAHLYNEVVSQFGS
jgi:Flp pilus assembly pilin Flp